MELNDIFLDMLPKIDLHGYDRESARVKVNDFVEEAYKMNYEKIILIHGVGSGIVKETVQETLYKNKKVISHHIVGTNIGCTIALIKKKDSKN